ncbi:MAG: HU family DNA-binding protein [Syntrophobacteraceae bacterium]|jgi:integration host factor subunit alpha
MTLTKAHLVEALFAKNIFTKTQSAHIIDTLCELIKQSLQNGSITSFSHSRRSNLTK